MTVFVNNLHGNRQQVTDASRTTTSKLVTMTTTANTWLPSQTLSLIKTRNSAGDEIANVNFLYDDIVHAVKYEPIALQLLEQTLELGLQLRFTRLGFSLEISVPEMVLLCTFSLYRAFQAPIRAEASASPSSWMIQPCIYLHSHLARFSTITAIWFIFCMTDRAP